MVDATRSELTDLLQRVRAVADSVDPAADERTWLGARFDAGLAWVHFPDGLGGSGLPRDWQTLVDAEFAAINAAAAPANGARNPIGLGMGAPTIAAHGTPEQQARLLRPLWTGEEIWCQLFSEPGAGSDLAGLATRAEREGDGWRINGQKVWTSYAHKARWGMLLARTDPDVPKHAGLTYFFLDMHSPGVEVRPLRQATGQAEFNEVFLTDVFIRDEMRVGAVGEGWKIANTTLMNERVALGSGAPQRESEPVASLLKLWRERPDLRTPELHSRLLQIWVKVETARLANARIRQQMLAGRPGPEGSAAKLTFAANNQEATRLRFELAGDEGLAYDDWTLHAWSRAWQPIAPRRTTTCGRAQTRSRAAAPRSCAASSPTASSACPANPAPTTTGPGRTFPDDDRDRASGRSRRCCTTTSRTRCERSSATSWTTSPPGPRWSGVWTRYGRTTTGSGDSSRRPASRAFSSPKSSAGSAASAVEMAVVLEELGRAAAPVPALTSAVLATTALTALPTSALGDVLEAMAAGEVSVAPLIPVSALPDGGWTPAFQLSADGRVTGQLSPVAGVLGCTRLLVPAYAGNDPVLLLVESADARDHHDAVAGHDTARQPGRAERCAGRHRGLGSAGTGGGAGRDHRRHRAAGERAARHRRAGARGDL